MGGPLSWAAVGIGAAFGAWLRWALAVWLTGVTAHIHLGTLLANWGGGYLIGIALGFFASYPHLAPEWRLLLVTGFLGGLTTFSTFSGESMMLLQRGAYAWALAHSALHLFGALLCAMAGFATWRALAP